eukprot:s2052_g21.t1
MTGPLPTIPQKLAAPAEQLNTQNLELELRKPVPKWSLLWPLDFSPSTEFVVVTSEAMASVTVLLNDPMQRGNDSEEARARILAALKTVDEARATGESKAKRRAGLALIETMNRLTKVLAKLLMLQFVSGSLPALSMIEDVIDVTGVGRCHQ